MTTEQIESLKSLPVGRSMDLPAGENPSNVRGIAKYHGLKVSCARKEKTNGVFKPTVNAAGEPVLRVWRVA